MAWVTFSNVVLISAGAQIITTPFGQITTEREIRPEILQEFGIGQETQGVEGVRIPSGATKVPGGQALLKAIKPSEYIVGPGDGLVLNIWGGFQALYKLTVFADGKVIIPAVGSLYVNGLTLERTQSLVTELVKLYYKDVMTSLSLTTLRVFEVRVVGEVRNPGSYRGTAVLRVSDLIEQAGGILPSGGSARWVQLRREGRVKSLDLFAFNKTGNEEENPLVNDEDIIVVPTRGATIVTVMASAVDVGSGVRIDQSFTRHVIELKEGERVSTLRGFLSTIDPWWDLKHAVIERTPANMVEPLRLPIDLERLWIKQDLSEDLVLLSGDVLTIPAIVGWVYVQGEVRRDGAFVYQPGRLARDYITLAGGLDERANLAKAYVRHADGSVGALREDTPIRSGDAITVPEVSVKWWQDYFTIALGIVTMAFYAVFTESQL